MSYTTRETIKTITYPKIVGTCESCSFSVEDSSAEKLSEKMRSHSGSAHAAKHITTINFFKTVYTIVTIETEQNFEDFSLANCAKGTWKGSGLYAVHEEYDHETDSLDNIIEPADTVFERISMELDYYHAGKGELAELIRNHKPR